MSQRLTSLDPTFALFKKHRASTIPQINHDDDAYTHISSDVFQHMITTNDFIQSHQRYGNWYGVSRQTYNALAEQHTIPLIHVGKYENLKALRRGGLQEGLSVLLWADRTIVQSRLIARHAHRQDGVDERLLAYDQEIAQLQRYQSLEPLDFDLLFVNNGSDPDQAARLLLSQLQTYSKDVGQQTRDQIVHLIQMEPHNSPVA